MNVPSVAMLRVVERLQREAQAYANDERRREQRHDARLPVTAVPCDEHGTPTGRPVEGVVVNISSNGIALLLTHMAESDHLRVTMSSGTGDRVAVLLNVTRCQPTGPYVRVCGPLVRRLANA